MTFFWDLFNIQADLRRRGRSVSKSLISEALACPRRSDSIGWGKIDEEKKGRMKPRGLSKTQTRAGKGAVRLILIYTHILTFSCLFTY